MALILAIESDRRQANQLNAIVRGRLHADLVLADTAERALAELGDRVPDLILTSALLSPNDELVLGDRLRSLNGKAAHVQTLTVPVLAAPRKTSVVSRATGMLSALRRERPQASATDGCDPDVFAQQCEEYLERAAEELRERTASDAIDDEVDERVGAGSPASALVASEDVTDASACNDATRVVHQPPTSATAAASAESAEPYSRTDGGDVAGAYQSSWTWAAETPVDAVATDQGAAVSFDSEPFAAETSWLAEVLRADREDREATESARRAERAAEADSSSDVSRAGDAEVAEGSTTIAESAAVETQRPRSSRRSARSNGTPASLMAAVAALEANERVETLPTMDAFAPAVPMVDAPAADEDAVFASAVEPIDDAVSAAQPFSMPDEAEEIVSADSIATTSEPHAIADQEDEELVSLDAVAFQPLDGHQSIPSWPSLDVDMPSLEVIADQTDDTDTDTDTDTDADVSIEEPSGDGEFEFIDVDLSSLLDEPEAVAERPAASVDASDDLDSLVYELTGNVDLAATVEIADESATTPRRPLMNGPRGTTPGSLASLEHAIAALDAFAVASERASFDSPDGGLTAEPSAGVAAASSPLASVPPAPVATTDASEVEAIVAASSSDSTSLASTATVAASAPSTSAAPAPNATAPAALGELDDLEDWFGVIAALQRQSSKSPRRPNGSTGGKALATPSAVHRERQARRQRRTMPDEWGIFDPKQCGFEALMARIEAMAQEDSRQ